MKKSKKKSFKILKRLDIIISSIVIVFFIIIFIEIRILDHYVTVSDDTEINMEIEKAWESLPIEQRLHFDSIRKMQFEVDSSYQD